MQQRAARARKPRARWRGVRTGESRQPRDLELSESWYFFGASLRFCGKTASEGGMDDVARAWRCLHDGPRVQSGSGSDGPWDRGWGRRALDRGSTRVVDDPRSEATAVDADPGFTVERRTLDPRPPARPERTGQPGRRNEAGFVAPIDRSDHARAETASQRSNADRPIDFFDRTVAYLIERIGRGPKKNESGGAKS